jgi:hypothetical protein
MKKILLCCFVIVLGLSSCSLLNKMGIGGGSKTAKQDGGCPSNGRNVGAEKLLSGNGKVIKQPKFRKRKSF